MKSRKTRRNIKVFTLILSGLLMLGFLAACGAASTAAMPETTIHETYVPDGMPEFNSETARDYSEPMMTTTAAGAEPNSPIDVAPPDSVRKIISNVSASLLVEDVKDVIQKLKQSTEALGGYVASSSLTESGNYYYANVSLRIPSAQVESFTSGLEKYGKITQQDSSTDDVTDSYYDIEARLKNAKTQEARLIEIMNQANTVEDLLMVRTELDQVQERIEQFQGKLKMWDQLTAYSSVNLIITEETKFTSIDEQADKPMSLAELWTSIKKGFNSSLNGIANFFSGLFIGISYAIVPLLLLAVFAFILFLIIRNIIRKQAKKRPPHVNTMPAPYMQYPGPQQEPFQAAPNQEAQAPLEQKQEDELKD